MKMAVPAFTAHSSLPASRRGGCASRSPRHLSPCDLIALRPANSAHADRVIQGEAYASLRRPSRHPRVRRDPPAVASFGGAAGNTRFDSDEMQHEVGQEEGREHGDDHGSDQPSPARPRAATPGVRFGGLPFVVLIGGARWQLAAISGRPIADQRRRPPGLAQRTLRFLSRRTTALQDRHSAPDHRPPSGRRWHRPRARPDGRGPRRGRAYDRGSRSLARVMRRRRRPAPRIGSAQA
jgi:hypothetical protein